MKLVPQSVTRNLARQTLIMQKNSPHIFFVGGVIGVVGSTVLACRATLKLEKNLDEIRRDVQDVKDVRAIGDDRGRKPSDHEYYMSMARVQSQGLVKLGRLYAPSILLGSISIAALTKSHVELTKRNAALSATLAAVTKAYDDYRARVREVIGEERELEIYRCMEDNEIEDDKGKKKVVKTIGDPNRHSVYAKCFDETNPNYQKSAEMNRVFLQANQNYFNLRLQAHGHVFLNDVYDALGFERTSAGAVCGWILNGEGDSYVDFKLFEPESAKFVNGAERAIWVDFNVDGIVYDKI
jgi:hypothetical protein